MVKEIDRRIIIGISMIIIAIPYIFPFALPLKIQQSTIDTHDTLESIPDGSTVLFAIDIGLESLAELKSGLDVIGKYLIERQFKIVIMSFYADGPVIFSTYFEPMLEEAGYKQGEDWVNLGYLAGIGVAYQSMATDIRSIIQTDYYGNQIDSLPLMDNINGASDLPIIITIDAYNSVRDFITYWGTPFGVPIVGFPSGTCYMVYYSDYSLGLCEGLINGARGIAEFEILTNYPGIAVAGIGAITVANLLVLFFVLIGNYQYFKERSKQGE